jgi:hypothetical protein
VNAVRYFRSTIFAPTLGLGLLATVLMAILLLAAVPPRALAAGSTADDLWLHMTVEETDGEEVRIRVNFPLRFAEALLPLMNGGNLHRGRVRIDIDDSDMGANDLVAAWRAVKEAREGQFVEIHPARGDRGDDDDEQVEAARVGDTLVLRARDTDSRAQIRVPMRVAETLVEAAVDSDADDSAEIDVAALLRDMREIGPGELVTATDGESHVRIWIDDDQEAE